MEMEIEIRPMDSQSLHYVDQFDRTSTVHEKLLLHLEENRLTYSIVPVPSYKKDLSVDAQDYTTFLDNPQKVIFFAYVDDRPVGQIKVVSWWNKLAYIEELTVDPNFRGHGVGRTLLTRAIEWAKGQGFPGVTLETQDNNIPACQLYASCGFELRGFDTHVYKGENPNTDEIALYWYLMF